MSKHWKPDESVVTPLPRGKRLKSLDQFTPPDFVGDLPARIQRVERQLPHGAKSGLILVAAACAGVAIAAYEAFGPREAIAPGAVTQWSDDAQAAGR